MNSLSQGPIPKKLLQLQPVDKPNKSTARGCARPGSSLVKCGQMSGKVTCAQTDSNRDEK